MKIILLIISLLYTLSYGDIFKNNTSISKENSHLIILYIIGKPNVSYYRAKERVAKRWGINMKVIFAGCLMSKDKKKQKMLIALDNEKSYKYYTKMFGKDWKVRFEKEVKKEKQAIISKR